MGITKGRLYSHGVGDVQRNRFNVWYIPIGVWHYKF